MLPIETAVELATVAFSGAVFIAVYRVFSFFRRTALAKPLLYMGAAFYLFFISMVFATLDNEFRAGLWPAPGVVQVLFFVVAAYGMLLFYKAYPAFAENEARLETAVRKIEAAELLHAMASRKRRLETESKVLRLRFARGELAKAAFEKAKAEKRREIAETDAAMRAAEAA
jgi:hypothetical protein